MTRDARLASLSASMTGGISMKTIAVALALVAVALATGFETATAAPVRAQTTTRVRVIMGHPGVFEFVLSKKTVPKGTVVFTLVNRGQIAHDFAITGKKSKLIQPGKSGLLKVVFRKAGRYPYKCTVPGHAEAGMKGVIKVL
jgi:uncharacterized cupredoxin-like copper-binding protein